MVAPLGPTLPALPVSLLLTLLLVLSPLTVDAQSTSSLPKVDFSSLGTVGVVGSFAGLSLYDPDQAAVTYSPTSSTLLSRTADGQLAKVGETNQGGVVAALCQSPSGTVFIGGTFTSFGGQDALNIASYDPATDLFAALATGLDGPVLALSCNGSTVYAGGDFSGPPAASGSGFAGNVAAWSTDDQAWSPLPFAGLNGPVATIAPSEDGRSLFFGGNFSTTFSNSTGVTVSSGSSARNMSYPSLGSSLVPLSLNQSDYVASPTTYISGFGRPQYIFCPRRGDGIGASWLLVDGAVGSFIARVYRPLQVRGIRLGNTFYEGRGTRNFSLTSIPDNTVLELTYASNASDPTSPLATCSANCELAHDESVPYQDFLFPDNTVMTGFELNIFGWYGAGAGLHLLQLLSEGAYAYAVADNNVSPCSAGLGATNQSTVALTGSWNTTSVVSSIAGTYQPVMIATVRGGTSVADAQTITWTPYVGSAGAYQIFVRTPGCQEQASCPRRTSVSVTVTPTGDGVGEATTTIIDQTNTADLSSLVYSGNLQPSSETTGVTVTMALADGAAPPAGSTFEIVADVVTLIAASTNGTTNMTTAQLLPGRGLFEFPLVDTGAFGDAVAASSNLNATGTLLNATGIDELAFKLDTGAAVNAVLSVGSGDGLRVFVAGDFTYSDGDTTSVNLLSYGADGIVTVAPNGGLAGPITTLTELDGVLYAAGAFAATTDGAVTGLGGVAKWEYNVAGSAWTAFGGSTPSVGNSVNELGIINTSTSSNATEEVVVVGGGGNGLAFYDPSAQAWNSTSTGLFIGNLTSFASATSLTEKNRTTYFAGNVIAAVSNAAPGGAVLSRKSDGSPKLTSFGFSLGSPASSSANSSASARQRRSTMRVVARALVDEVVAALSPRSTSHAHRGLVLEKRAPAASVNITLPTAITASATNQVLTGAFWKNGSTDYMILGGKFTDSSDGIENIGLYDTKRKVLKPLEGLEVDGAVTSLTVFKNSLWIGGNFSTASGRSGLSTYALKTSTLDESQPGLVGYSGSNATVNVIAQRPGFDSQFVVAGAFAQAGSLPCQSICSWDADTLQWSSLGGGLQGVVGAVSFAGDNSEYLLAAGHFTFAGDSAFLAQWHFSNSTWTTVGARSALPGPATAISSDNHNINKIFVAGSTDAAEPYLYFYNGTDWTDVNAGALQTGSGVQQLVFVPVSSDHAGNDIVESDRMLMVSGDLNINSSSISSALFDGNVWYPYLVSTATSGSAGVVSQLFYSVTNFSLSAARHLGVGIVILISIAIALGVVFLLVLIGILVALARRREEDHPHPVSAAQAREHEGEGDSVRAAHRPTSLLATVGAATAVLLDGGNEKQREAKQSGATGHAHDDSIAGPISFDDEPESYDSHQYDDTTGRARYSFHAEHPGELSVSAGEDLTILESGDPNWFLVANSQGQRGLMPSSYLA